ncbi:alpha-N-acetylneuraminide alpha-2,8-sialyltransferase-like [Elgaria multicarinata webbii]|uniref:alpha-N-acetylneuraminide alpha-2,8-sialyltransferase-like n=1 Tax=Elgaria multicarinata webbii TaxID=159646 RepID=UPI002FCD676D
MAFNVRRRKQDNILGICVIFIVSLTLWMLQRPKQRFQFQKTNSNVDLVSETDKCTLQMEDKKILEQVVFKQEFPWEPNTSAVAQYRAELERCCNTSFRLILTKENITLRTNVNLWVEQDKLLEEAELKDLLPERSPFLGAHYRHCAVVGSGGILRNSRCGQEIDQADLVVRFNLPPMNFSEDVGTKTTLMTINPSIIMLRYKNLEFQRKPFVDALRSYRGALFIMPAFSFVDRVDGAYRALYTMKDFGLLQRFFILNPHYLNALTHYWKEKGLQPSRLSSGFVYVNIAFEFCQHVTLYGFWPFLYDLDSQPILHHYYDHVMPMHKRHFMCCEFSRYLGMHAQGALRLQLGKCQ